MKYKLPFILFLFSDIALFSLLLLNGKNFAVLNPAGMIANQERALIITVFSLGLLVVIPVFILIIYTAYTYRAGNHKAKYNPDWDHNTKLQTFWWAFPMLIITIVAVILWIYTHKLDPRNSITASSKTMTVQVIALRWKWLFIYPEQGIATVNYIEIPQKTPINFVLTADEAPMNSFWVPQLGGQIYAMSGMITQTHLVADNIGQYYGTNSEISGQGFAGMRFLVKSVSQSDFNDWIMSVKETSQKLNTESYSRLSIPSEYNKPAFYASTENNLYTTIVMKYMAHSKSKSIQDHAMSKEMNGMQGM